MNERSHSYESPLSSRYASREMSALFSPFYKHLTWRKLWIALAKAEQKLGLAITDKQIHALEKHLEPIDFAKAAEYEKTLRHDVMAHIQTFADQCPEARAIIHLGATSCFVTDNTDLIQMREGLSILTEKLSQVIRQLSAFAKTYAHLATLSYTHLQPAQPTTVGKRACLWLQDFVMDLTRLEYELKNLRFLGVKGATGTQASFLQLFNNDASKVEELDKLVAEEMGFSKPLLISGQTYTRKQDLNILYALSGLAVSAHKFGTDLRLLAHMKEMEEPFTDTQVGSSAMPYKRNPTHSERLCGIARFLISLSENPAYTAATQWLERTLDDSANRRLSIPEAFLSADSLLNILGHLTSGLIVYPKMIEKHLKQELPFMATEHILMEAVKRGKDRQHVHEALRKHTQASSRKLKERGESSDLFHLIAEDPAIGLSKHDIEHLAQADHFTGMAEEQVHHFLRTEVDPILIHYPDIKPTSFSIQV
jgi:adenylosuccinate lyase